MPASNPWIDVPHARLAQVPPQSRSASTRETAWRELVGFVPPCGEDRDKAALEPLLGAMHEQLRVRPLMPPAFSAKAAHLVLLALMVKDHGAHACAQAVAARRAGASWDDLEGVISLVTLVHGQPAANRGEELLTALIAREHAERLAGAVAAYG